MVDNKRAFISYSHDSDSHKEWVKGLAKYLVSKGIEVLLDEWDVEYGDDLPAFMEQAIRDTDRVIAICTDAYIEKANNGIGGVGYEKTIATGEILKSSENRRRFIPVVRNVIGKDKMPTFFGGALYLDLSDELDTVDNRNELVRTLHGKARTKPVLGKSPFVSDEDKPNTQQTETKQLQSLGHSTVVEFSDRFSRAFPGLRRVQWIDESQVIADRLGILLGSPLRFQEGHVAWWWRGPANLQIETFERMGGRHYLMDVEELNIKRIAAVNPGFDYRKFVYVETNADLHTGLYPISEESLADLIAEYGYVSEEYGLVDGKLLVTRAEYDDGAALIDDKPVDIRRRVSLRSRFVTPYNFLIAPNNSPINNNDFDYTLQGFLNNLLKGDDVFDQMCEEILKLPRRAI